MRTCVIIILIFSSITVINCQTKTIQPVPIEVIEKWLNGCNMDSIRFSLQNCGLYIHEEYVNYIEEWDFSSPDFENQRRHDKLDLRYLFCHELDNPNRKMAIVDITCRWGHPYAKSFLRNVKRSFPVRKFESNTHPCMDCSEKERNQEYQNYHFSRLGSDIKVTLTWTLDGFGLSYTFSRGY